MEKNVEIYMSPIHPQKLTFKRPYRMKDLKKENKIFGIRNPCVPFACIMTILLHRIYTRAYFPNKAEQEIKKKCYCHSNENNKEK